MKRSLIGAFILCSFLALIPGTASAIEWMAFAANGYSVGYGQAGSEEGARDIAIAACELRSGRTCDAVTTSVPTSWYLVAVSCNGIVSTGGSQFDFATANQVASQKVGYLRCRVLAQQ